MEKEGAWIWTTDTSATLSPEYRFTATFYGNYVSLRRGLKELLWGSQEEKLLLKIKYKLFRMLLLFV
jgi:hypothetical protein